MSNIKTTSTADFTFTSEGVLLSGSLESPCGSPVLGSVLLFSGSGPQDRDETIAGKKPFRELSHALALRGYQVLRWDDRGVGASRGDYLSASAQDLVNDGVNAMLAMEKETAFDRHVLLGHSQGTLIATAVAASHPSRVAGLVLLAGMGLPGRESLLEQHVRICEAEGWSDPDIAASLAQKAALFDRLIDAQSKIDAGQAATAVLQDLKSDLWADFLGHHQRSDLSEDEVRDIELTVEDLIEWEWRYLLATDPATDISKVACPVLAICGECDSQVLAGRNLAAIKAACKRGRVPDIEVHALADYNHLFQQTSSAAISDYDSLGPPFEGEVVSVILSWLSQQESGKQAATGR